MLRDQLKSLLHGVAKIDRLQQQHHSKSKSKSFSQVATTASSGGTDGGEVEGEEQVQCGV